MASASTFENRATHGLEISLHVLSGYSMRTLNPAFFVPFEAESSVNMCVHSSGKLCILPSLMLLGP